MLNTAGAVRINNSFNHELVNDAAAWGEGEEKNINKVVSRSIPQL